MAFEPMFDDNVKIVSNRPSLTIRGTFAACVFPIQFADPFAEDTAQTEIRRFSVLIKKGGPRAWNYKDPIRIGDKITLKDGLKTAVTKVNLSTGPWFDVETRQIS